mgnify:CR=1 FL=1
MYLKGSYYRPEKAESTSTSTVPPTDPEFGYRLSGGFFSLEAGLVFLGSLGNSQPKIGRKPVALETGDFNGDRIQDIAISNYGDGNLSIVLGRKDGIFKLKTKLKVGRLPIAVAAGDFNNDEKLDPAVTLWFDKLVILLGKGDGNFKLAESYKAPGTPAYMTVGDFNSDKNLDIAIAFNAVRVNFIRIFYGNGDGTLKNPVRIESGG